MKQKSTTGGQHKFAEIPNATIQRSKFNRSNGLKTTFDAGLLVPIFVDEALPGDTMSLKATMFGRLATPIHPVMENLFMDTFFFAVPFVSSGTTGKNSTASRTTRVTPPTSSSRSRTLARWGSQILHSRTTSVFRLSSLTFGSTVYTTERTT